MPRATASPALPSNAPRALLLAGLLLAATLASGCLGGSEETPTGTGADDASGSDTLARSGEDNGTLTATTPEDMTGGHAPHVHNYWGTEDRMLLFDGPVTTRILSGSTFVNLILRREAALGGTVWELPEGATVYEGTGLLEVTATWTEPTITALGLAYKPSNVPWSREAFDNMQPLVNGQPLAIEVTPEMTDMPHEAVSRWAFHVGATGQGSVAEGEFDLKIEILRMRDISAFPGHPVTYVETDEYLLAEKDFAYRSNSFMTEIVTVATGADSPEPLAPDQPVPMGTGALIVKIRVDEVVGGTPAAATDGLYLFYRTASGERGRATELDPEEGFFVFGIPVEERDVDSPYTDGSAWRFAPYVRQAIEVGEWDIGLCGGCFDAEIRGHIVVTAYAEDPTGEIEDEDD